MPKLIKDAQVLENNWQTLAATDEAETVTVPEGAVIVPLNVWLAQGEQLRERSDVGVWLDSDELPDALADDCANLPLIAVNFPGFMDGRGFSIGRLLRERFAFGGELRAIGQPIRDQLSYLTRCGFNAFDCNEAFDLVAALNSLQDFSESYQYAVDQEAPLFRRRVG